jgi:predicted esterase
MLVAVGVSDSAEILPLSGGKGEMTQNIACASDPTQTYTLYLPSTFTDDERWPVLLVFDPRGRSLHAAELFKDAAEEYGWMIVSSDNTRSDGPWEPNLLAIEALWPEVHTRLPADFSRIYAAGFSGGVAVATLLSKTTGEIAGIIGCGGRLFESQYEENRVPFFGTAGDLDFNFLQMHLLDEFLAENGNPHRLVIFEGTHTWMPESVAREAIEWLELLAMKSGARTPHPELIDALFAADLERALSLAEDGRLVDAARRLREMEMTYDGLHDVADARKAAGRIEAGDGFRRQRKRASKTRNYLNRCLARRDSELTRLRRSEIPPPAQQLAGNLHIRDLLKTADRPSEDGKAAQWCLNALYTAVSFYLPLAELPNERYPQVAVSYELANMIRDDNAVVWYNLACVRALTGQKKEAVEALRRALENGFQNWELIQNDPDLDSIRKRDDFAQLMGSIPE